MGVDNKQTALSSCALPSASKLCLALHVTTNVSALKLNGALSLHQGGAAHGLVRTL